MTSGPQKRDAGQSPAHNPDQDPQHEARNPMVADRRMMPVTRDSITHKFSLSGHEGYLTIGMDTEGRPGEIFIKMSKEGSTLSGMCQAYCRAFSLALQYGLPIEDAVVRFRGMRFEPMGLTSNPDIPEASSIVDYVARYLEHLFLGQAGPVGADRAGASS